MYETMVFWETAHTLPDAPQHIYEFARLDLDLVDERRLGNGVVHLAYRPKS